MSKRSNVKWLKDKEVKDSKVVGGVDSVFARLAAKTTTKTVLPKVTKPAGSGITGGLTTEGGTTLTAGGTVTSSGGTSTGTSVTGNVVTEGATGSTAGTTGVVTEPKTYK